MRRQQRMIQIGDVFEVGSSYIFKVESMTIQPGIASPALYCKLIYGWLPADQFDNGLMKLDGDTVLKKANFVILN
jgi:hypothetical protein